jgi:hypothetical protein
VPVYFTNVNTTFVLEHLYMGSGLDDSASSICFAIAPMQSRVTSDVVRIESTKAPLNDGVVLSLLCFNKCKSDIERAASDVHERHVVTVCFVCGVNKEYVVVVPEQGD